MQEEVDTIAKNIAWALTRKMGISGEKLHGKLRRAGRRLPKDVRADIELITAAQSQARSPEHMRSVDLGALQRASDRIMAYLETQDAAEVRRGFYINLFKELTPRVLGLLVILLLLLIWHGAS